MKKFSWYTIPIKLTKLSTVYQYAVDRFIPFDVDRHGFGRYIHIRKGAFVVDEDGGWQSYKPNRKGGHTHNHQRNALERKLNRSKESRKRCHNVLNKGFEYKIVRKGNGYFAQKIKEKMKKVEDTEIPINAPVLGIIGAIVVRTSPSYRELTPEEIEMREKVWELTKGLCDIQEEEAEKERALQRGRVALQEDFENDDDTMIHLFRD